MTDSSRTSLNPAERKLWWISFIGFWLLGLCNNFAYVVMLSAAHDILAEEQSTGSNKTAPDTHHANNSLDCNKLPASVILLADILPALFIKITAPFFMHKIHYDIRFIFIAIFSAGALITVGLSYNMVLSLFGVACASISSGFGEITMLQLTSFFSESTITAWSSGTGAAGILGSLSYTGLTSLLKVKPRTAMLILLFIPVIQVFSYVLIRTTGQIESRSNYENIGSDPDDRPLPSDRGVSPKPQKSRWSLIKPLLKYMIPLSLVYFAEYLINQGLYELVFVKQSTIDHKSQYRWYSVCYQLGVFLSRSSVALFRINQLWILPIIQFLNMGVFFVCIFRAEYIPSIWPIFGLIVFEGLIGGGAYVNTFYKISLEIPKEDREYSLGVASVGDSFGITAAGFSAIPLHDLICSHFDASF